MAQQKGIGRLIQIGLAKESTRGTAQSSATFWNPWMDLTLDEKKEFATDNQAYGLIEDSVNMTRTKAWAAGSLNGAVMDTTFGLLLYGMFGGYSVSGSGPYTHTFTVNESAQHKSLTIFKHDPLTAQDYSYANGVVEKLEINIALKKFVEFTASLLALSGAAQSNFSPSTTTENRFVPQYLAAGFAPTYTGVTGTLTATGTAASTVHVTGCSINPQLNLKVGMTVTGTNIPANTTVAKIVSSTAYDLSQATTGAIGTQTFGPAIVALKSAKITINSNVESQDVLGSVAPADFLNKEFSIEGTFEAILQNETDFKTFFMGTNNSNLPQPLAMQFLMTNTDATYSATNPSLNITLAKCYMTEYGVPYKVKDLVYQTVKFKAVYSLTDSLMGSATLINGTTTY
jgi:Phage tail tube protein